MLKQNCLNIGSNYFFFSLQLFKRLCLPQNEEEKNLCHQLGLRKYAQIIANYE